MSLYRKTLHVGSDIIFVLIWTKSLTSAPLTPGNCTNQSPFPNRFPVVSRAILHLKRWSNLTIDPVSFIPRIFPSRWQSKNVQLSRGQHVISFRFKYIYTDSRGRVLKQHFLPKRVSAAPRTAKYVSHWMVLYPCQLLRDKVTFIGF